MTISKKNHRLFAELLASSHATQSASSSHSVSCSGALAEPESKVLRWCTYHATVLCRWCSPETWATRATRHRKLSVESSLSARPKKAKRASAKLRNSSEEPACSSSAGWLRVCTIALACWMAVPSSGDFTQAACAMRSCCVSECVAWIVVRFWTRTSSDIDSGSGFFVPAPPEFASILCGSFPNTGAPSLISSR